LNPQVQIISLWLAIELYVVFQHQLSPVYYVMIYFHEIVSFAY